MAEAPTDLPETIRRARAEQMSILSAGLAREGAFRWVATDVTDVTRAAQAKLDLGPVASIAFGRAAASAAMLLRLTSKTPHRLVLEFRASGPLERVVVEVGEGGSVRGVVGDPHATGPEGSQDLDVAAALGIGLLRVRREEQRESRGPGSAPASTVSYESQVELATSEIGSDVAYYLQQSEQRRCAIAVGVDVGPKGIVRAGGLLVEALPNAPEEEVSELENAFPGIDPVTEKLRGVDPDGLARTLFPDATVLERHPLAYRCRCTEETVAARLATLPPSDIADLSDDDGIIAAECAYCRTVYRLKEAELLAQATGEN